MKHLLLANIFPYSVTDHSCPLSYTFSHLVRYLYKKNAINFVIQRFFFHSFNCHMVFGLTVVTDYPFLQTTLLFLIYQILS